MIIGSYTLPDPQSFDVTDYVGTTEEILLSGDRRYLKYGNNKKNISLVFYGISDTDKDNIETLAASTGTLSVTLDGESYTVVSYSDPKFTRIKGSNQLYQCNWELREP